MQLLLSFTETPVPQDSGTLHFFPLICIDLSHPHSISQRVLPTLYLLNISFHLGFQPIPQLLAIHFRYVIILSVPLIKVIILQVVIGFSSGLAKYSLADASD